MRSDLGSRKFIHPQESWDLKTDSFENQYTTALYRFKPFQGFKKNWDLEAVVSEFIIGISGFKGNKKTYTMQPPTKK